MCIWASTEPWPVDWKTNSFSLGSHVLSRPSPCWNVDWFDLVQVTTSPWVHECSGESMYKRYCFSLVLPYLWLLTPSALSSDKMCDLGDRSDRDIPFVAKYFTDTYSLFYQSWVSPLNNMCCIRKSLGRALTAALVCGYWDTNLEGIFILCHFYRDNSIRFTPVACHFPNHGFLARFTELGMCYFLWSSPSNPIRKWLLTFLTFTALLYPWA